MSISERATFTLEPESHAFLQKVGGNNKSAYINELLKREKRKALEEALTKANIEEAEDPHYQAEIALWDVTLADGLAD